MSGVPDGLYGVYFTGSQGYGAFGVLLLRGAICGVDAQGGDIVGGYERLASGNVRCDIKFAFLAGAVMVDGSTLPQNVIVPFNIEITPAILAGEIFTADLGVVRVNAAVRLKMKI